MWIAHLLLLKDIELACDEKAIKDMDTNERKSYSKALVNLAVKSNKIAVCPLAFGEVSVKSRVEKALSYKKPLFWIVAAAIIVCLIAGTCLLANPVEQMQTIEDISEIYGTYHPDKVVYVNPLSSFYPFDLDKSPYYTIGENKFSYIIPKTDESTVVDDPQYELIDLTQEEFEDLFMMEIDMTDSSQYESIKRIVISEEYSLFIMDSELWLASFNGDKIWMIYRLQPSEPYINTNIIEKKRMTMDELIELVELKGNKLTMQDFSKYEYSDIHFGSGVVSMTLEVPIDDDYCILTGEGGVFTEEGGFAVDYTFVKLIRLDSYNETTDDRLDLMSDYVDLEGFLGDSTEELKWTYMPWLSSIFPAVPIRLAVPYHAVKVKVDKGSLYIHNGTETKNVGKEYTYAEREIIYWSPHSADGYDEADIADSCELSFTVIEYYQRAIRYKGKVHIESNKNSDIYNISIEDELNELEVSRDYNSRVGFVISRKDN